MLFPSRMSGGGVNLLIEEVQVGGVLGFDRISHLNNFIRWADRKADYAQIDCCPGRGNGYAGVPGTASAADAGPKTAGCAGGQRT